MAIQLLTIPAGFLAKHWFLSTAAGVGAYAYREKLGDGVSNIFNDTKSKVQKDGVIETLKDAKDSVVETVSNAGNTIDETRESMEKTYKRATDPAGAIKEDLEKGDYDTIVTAITTAMGGLLAKGSGAGWGTTALISTAVMFIMNTSIGNMIKEYVSDFANSFNKSASPNIEYQTAATLNRYEEPSASGNDNMATPTSADNENIPTTAETHVRVNEQMFAGPG